MHKTSELDKIRRNISWIFIICDLHKPKASIKTTWVIQRRDFAINSVSMLQITSSFDIELIRSKNLSRNIILFAELTKLQLNNTAITTCRGPVV